MEEVRRWVEDSPYGVSLGVRLESLDAKGARLLLPFREENSNPGQALHGGCAASLAVIGGQTVARYLLGAESAPWHTCNMQVSYLSAAIGEDVVAQATLLRRGKELCFVNTTVETLEGKPIAAASSIVRGRFAKERPALARSQQQDDGSADPGPLGAAWGKLNFIAGRGIGVEHMAGGTARLVMPLLPENADLSGDVHEGAVLALLDTAGASAAWAECGVGPYKASTAGIQVQNLAATPATDLVAYARCTQRDAEIFFSEVEVVDGRTREVTSRGTVLYRIVT